MTAQAALVAAVRALKAAEVPDAPRDARRLLCFAMRIAPDRLTLHLGDTLTAEQTATYDAAVAARATRTPVSHITGTRAFYGREFIVTPDVLDPRPETETLIEAALAAPFTRVLDLGTGSGCILLTLLAENPSSVGQGVDLSPPALAIARKNAQVIGGTATFLQSDWFTKVEGVFDLIVSNPPYIAEDEMQSLSPEVKKEPRMALTDEKDGLNAYRIIAAQAPRHLAHGGRLMVEIGPTQGAAVAELFHQAGLVDVRILPDLDGRDRVVSAMQP